jgi:hypothetical protein
MKTRIISLFVWIIVVSFYLLFVPVAIVGFLIYLLLEFISKKI